MGDHEGRGSIIVIVATDAPLLPAGDFSDLPLQYPQGFFVAPAGGVAKTVSAGLAAAACEQFGARAARQHGDEEPVEQRACLGVLHDHPLPAMRRVSEKLTIATSRTTRNSIHAMVAAYPASNSRKPFSYM